MGILTCENETKGKGQKGCVSSLSLMRKCIITIDSFPLDPSSIDFVFLQQSPNLIHGIIHKFIVIIF